MTQRAADVIEDAALDATVRSLKALAHPIRLGIVQMLADKRSFGIDDESCCAQSEVCVCKITERFDVSMPTISHHLKLLREAGLVDTRRDGVWNLSHLAPRGGSGRVGRRPARRSRRSPATRRGC